MLIDDYRAAIRVRGLSPKTFDAYWPHVVEFLRFSKHGNVWRRPEELAEPEVVLRKRLTGNSIAILCSSVMEVCFE